MSKFSVRKPLTIFVAVIAIIILGVVAFTRMTPDLLPNMDFPYVMIMTTWPGQSPEIIEAEISRPLEQSMATLDHIKEVTSSSSENYSLVMLEFENSVNMDTIGVDIQQNISALQGSWDEAVGAPYVLKVNPSVLPVAIAAASMEGMDITELSDFLDETIVPKLEGVTGVARVTTSGSIYRQLNVVISQEKIDDVNARMADAVNSQLDDAKAELEDTKAELDDAKAELDDAKAELDSGKETLINQTSSAQAAITGQQSQLVEGKMQLESQIAQLQSTRDTLVPAIDQLQQAEDGYAQAEAGLSQLQDEIDWIDQRAVEIGEILPGVEADMQTLSARAAELQGLIAAYAPADGFEMLPEDAEYLAQLQGELADVQSRLQAAQDQMTSLQTELATGQATRPALEAQMQTVQGTIDTLDQTMAAQGIEGRAGLQAKLAELQGNLAQVDDGLAQLNTALDQVNSGQGQLSAAMGTLSQSQSAGLLEMANAAAEINRNAASVESGLEQVESGLEEIENSRADALDQADISGSITLANVAQILGAQNFAMPAGYVEQDGIEYMVSVGDEIEDEEELENLLLFDTGEDAIGPVYLKDVADVFITDNSGEVYAKLDGENSVMLTFDKQSNAATAEVSDGLRARFDELEEEYPGLSFVFLIDQGDYIHLIIDSIMQSLLTGALFAILVLFLFLRDIRPTAITLVSIPVSVIFAFVLMYFSGVTLNMVSMSGLAVAVGMLVDNSIVVIENIYRLRSKGATPVQAAVAGAKQVAGAVTSSTLTTVCVFLPIIFVEGITRELFTDLAITMTYSLLASLIIALTLVPAMAKGLLKKEKKKRKEGEGFIYRAYRAMAGWNLRHKWVVICLSIIALGLSAWAALQKGFSFMPEIDMNTTNVNVTMPEDITRDEAVALADEIMGRIQTMPDVEYVGAMMGRDTLMSMGRDTGSLNVTVYVGMPEGQSGAAAGREIVDMCSDLPCEMSYESAMMSMSMLTGSGVTVNVYGQDLETIQNAARQVAGVMETVEGVAVVDDGLEEAETAYHVTVDKNAAMAKGFTVAQLYMELAEAMTDSATALTMEMDTVSADVVVQTEGGLTMDELKDYTFNYTDREGNSGTFRLDEVAKIEPTVSLATISRIDQRRYIAVTASLEEGYNVTLVTDAVNQALSAETLPEGVTYEFDGENEVIMEAVQDMMLMLAIGVALVYFIMVAQFQSLKSPFIVMFTIPLAFTGGFAALLLFDMDVSIVSIIGFVMLVGIIVNNGIVLVDYVNQLRAGGMERRAALVEAGVTRMRPIFMTSLTTILGLIVMAMGKNVGTSIMQPVAVVCIGGLLYATIMTLFVVPCIYDIISRKELKVLTDEDMEFNEL